MSARLACTSCYLIILVTDYSLTIHDIQQRVRDYKRQAAEQ